MNMNLYFIVLIIVKQMLTYISSIGQIGLVIQDDSHNNTQDNPQDFVVAHVEADGVGAEMAGEPGEDPASAVHEGLIVVGVEDALARVCTLLKFTVEIPVPDLLEKLITSPF